MKSSKTNLQIFLLKGGVQVNVVPSELAAYFDIRVTPSIDLDEMEEQLKQWCKESGEGIQMEFLQCLKKQTLTSTKPGNLWYHCHKLSNNITLR